MTDIPFEQIDNHSKIVCDDLKQTMTSGSTVSVATSMFSIYAFEKLKTQLASIKEFRFLFTSPTFVKSNEQKDKREFYIPKLLREQGVLGSQFELRLRNELTQKAVAR